MIKKIIKKLISHYLKEPGKIVLENNVILRKNVFVDASKVKFDGNNSVGENAVLVGDIHIQNGTTIGQGAQIFGPLKIGKYCQFGPFIGIYASEHPTNTISIYTNKNLFQGSLQKNIIERAILVGSDVWIGHGAIILKGVTIGDGAIIAAGAVVTKNVEPYSIVAGNPAKHLKYRFDEVIRLLLLELKWWDLPENIIHQYQDVFQKRDLELQDLIQLKKRLINL